MFFSFQYSFCFFLVNVLFVSHKIIHLWALCNIASVKHRFLCPCHEMADGHNYRVLPIRVCVSVIFSLCVPESCLDNFQNNPKNLDPPYKMDQDLCDC